MAGRKEYIPREAERKKIASGIHEGYKKTSPGKGLSIPTKRPSESIRKFIGRLETYDARHRAGGRLVQTEIVHPTGRDPVPRKLGRQFVRPKDWKPTPRVIPRTRRTSK
jgi:hypothetical protein